MKLEFYEEIRSSSRLLEKIERNFFFHLMPEKIFDN